MNSDKAISFDKLSKLIVIFDSYDILHNSVVITISGHTPYKLQLLGHMSIGLLCTNHIVLSGCKQHIGVLFKNQDTLTKIPLKQDFQRQLQSIKHKEQATAPTVCRPPRIAGAYQVDRGRENSHMFRLRWRRRSWAGTTMRRWMAAPGHGLGGAVEFGRRLR
jgi:hypothetical protein